jgi:hypothetical protein
LVIRHVEESRRLVARQRVLVAHKRTRGLDTSASERLLASFERRNSIFEAELAALTPAVAGERNWAT